MGDAQAIEVPSSWDASLKGDYDAVFSNAALHWCKQNPKGVIESAKRLLKPEGRFVIEMGGQMNCIGESPRKQLSPLLKQYEPRS